MENNKISQRFLDYLRQDLAFAQGGCTELLDIIDTIANPDISDCMRSTLLTAAEIDLTLMDFAAKNTREFLAKIKEMEDKTNDQ